MTGVATILCVAPVMLDPAAARRAGADLASDVGICTLLRSRGGQEVKSSRGKFVVAARPDPHGVWRFEVDGYSDLPED